MTTRIRIISGVAGTSFDVPAAAYNGELLGVWGQKAPGSTGAGLKVLLGVGKAHGFSGLPPALIKRKRHLQASLPLNPLCGNIAVKGRSAIPPPSGVSICSLFPLTIFDFFRDR